MGGNSVFVKVAKRSYIGVAFPDYTLGSEGDRVLMVYRFHSKTVCYGEILRKPKRRSGVGRSVLVSVRIGQLNIQ